MFRLGSILRSCTVLMGGASAWIWWNGRGDSLHGGFQRREFYLDGVPDDGGRGGVIVVTHDTADTGNRFPIDLWTGCLQLVGDAAARLRNDLNGTLHGVAQPAVLHEVVRSGGWATLADASGTTPFYTDRITSGTAGVFVSNTGIINLRTGGVTTGYLDTAGRLVAPGISITTANGISSTFGSFAREIQVGTSGATCSSANSGAIRYASTILSYCDGSSWHAIFGEGSDPAGFAFTDQLSVNANALVTSNAVNLGSFAGTLTATCRGCSAIARNGVWGGTTLGGFTAGDTISLRHTSSASYDTAVVANATVGSKTSNPWTVRTASLAGPNAFAFTNVSDAATNWTYTSEAVTLTGFTGTLTATCTGCSAIARNGSWTGGTTLGGFTAGDTIAIRQNTATTTPATSTSIAAVRRCRERRFRRDGGADGSDAGAVSGATIAGTNAGIVSAALRASRRHVNSCCGDKAWRRATALTVAPGSKLSATIRVFSSGAHSRRRPAPVKSSNRRIGSSALDLSVSSEIVICPSPPGSEHRPLSLAGERWGQETALTMEGKRLCAAWRMMWPAAPKP